MRRTTQDLALALQNMGIDASYENTGGGCMCVHVPMPDGKYFYVTDDVPVAVYDYRETESPWEPATVEHMRSLWSAYDGGFSLNTTTGDHILSGVLPGYQNIYALPSATDVAKEYVKMFKHFGLEPRAISKKMDAELSNFLHAGYRLSDAWDDWVEAPHRYPPYLPEFNEFLSDFGAYVRGDIDN